jgi:hypothetical protein
MDTVYDWDFFRAANAEFDEQIKIGIEKAKWIEELLEGTGISKHWKTLAIEQDFVQSGYNIDYFTDKTIRKVAKALRDDFIVIKQKYGWEEYEAWYKTQLGSTLRNLLRSEYEKYDELPEDFEYQDIKRQFGKHHMDIHQLHQLGESVYNYFTNELSEINFVTESLLKEGHSERTVRYSMSKIFIKNVWSFLKGA